MLTWFPCVLAKFCWAKFHCHVAQTYTTTVSHLSSEREYLLLKRMPVKTRDRQTVDNIINNMKYNKIMVIHQDFYEGLQCVSASWHVQSPTPSEE